MSAPHQDMAGIGATRDDTWINWSGATVYDMTTGEGVYVQISGPDVHVEFASQQGSAGADVDGVTTSGWGHIHTIYRDEATGVGAGGGPAGGPPAGAAPSGG